MRKQSIAWSLTSLLLLPFFVGAAAAFVFIDPAAKIQRIVMMANQLTQSSNQITQIAQIANQLTELKGQFQHIKDASMGQIQALTQPFTQLASQGTSLVSDGMAWKDQFAGAPGQLADSLTDMGSSGDSLTGQWSNWLQQADTVTESDIAQVFSNQAPARSQLAVDGWRKNRERADKRLVMDNAVADAAAQLADALREAKTALDGLQNQSNMSDTALAQAQLAGSVTKGNLNIAQAQLAAFQAAQQAAANMEQELRRREQQDAWLRAQQAAQQNLQTRQAAIEASQDDMRQQLLMKVNPFYGYSYTN